MDRTQQPGIRIAQIFLERAAFAHRADFLAFPPETPISVEVEIFLSADLTRDKKHARLQLGARSKEAADSLYAFDVLMTALIEAEGDVNMPLEHYLVTNGGALVFPFLREAVANMTGRGRFGPVWLKPVNLLALATKQEELNLQESPIDQ